MGVNEKLLQGKLAERPGEETMPVEELLKAVAKALIQEEEELKNEKS